MFTLFDKVERFSLFCLVVWMFFLYSSFFNNKKTSFFIIKKYYNNIKIFLNCANIYGYFFLKKSGKIFGGFVGFFILS